MAENKKNTMNMRDGFAPIANHYDEMMEHVDYDRWFHIATSLCGLLPSPFRHLEAGCGTGVLMKRLVESGWDSAGMDLSPAMLRVARQRYGLNRLVQANFCALPFREHFHIVTCLFDSLNFLLTEEAFTEALGSFYKILAPNGVFYFDVVTEKMIADHFENTSWTESHEKFRTSWVSAYERATHTCETRVRINSGDESITYERIYPTKFILDALVKTGFEVLGIRDANTWKEPTRRTTRIDFVVVKGDAGRYQKAFKQIDKEIRMARGHGV